MKFIAKTLYGLENVLAAELAILGAGEIEKVNRAVTFSGSMELLYSANYSLRTALSVLMNIAEFRIRTKDDLYRESSRIDWDRYLDIDHTFSIVPVVNSPHFSHTAYPGLILKDSIADYFRKRSGKRPSVDAQNPDLLINLHISNENVSVSLDSSVMPLFKRGYRQESAIAPLNEVLAAGILMISGWNVSSSLTDPMCGSGTISIEAGMIACNIPAGKFRESYGFRKWKDYDEELYLKTRKSADSRITKSSVRIFCSDIEDTAVTQARLNIKRAGLSDTITAETSDFKDLKARDEHGYLFLNPPYGQRLRPDETDELYNMIGSTLKHNFPGASVWLISSNKESLKHVGLKPSKKHTLFNGALECTLVNYEMYTGSRKNK